LELVLGNVQEGLRKQSFAVISGLDIVINLICSVRLKLLAGKEAIVIPVSRDYLFLS
jgi:hypothetical protein